jgi:hypothetical protein
MAAPWTQWPVVGSLRAALRRKYFEVVRRTSGSDDGRAILARALGEVWLRPPPFSAALLARCPYPFLGRASTRPSGPRPVFITAQFRTGSTLLWNIFRHVEACTSYYEPLNERRWFDPATRGDWVDPTHTGVDDYWREYDGLAAVGSLYREEWTRRRLYMNETSTDVDLERYVAALVAGARGVAVLQFNRVDFRLPWLRAHFPRARLVHLYRNPRDQWCSALARLPAVPRDVTIDRFQPYDHFYLRPWAQDLKYHFPCLDPARGDTAYRIFYYIWKLSYCFGAAYAHHSLALESLLANPREELATLMALAGVPDYDERRLVGLINANRTGRWESHADSGWFERHEAACEDTLSAFWQDLAEARRPGPSGREAVPEEPSRMMRPSLTR